MNSDKHVTNTNILVFNVLVSNCMTKRRKTDIGIVYTLTSPSGKQYVGITTKRRFRGRMLEHQKTSSGCRYLKNAIQKYGWENFSLEFREVPVDKLNKEEIEQIKRLGTMAPKGYNLTSGGERTVFSDETKKKMSASLKKTYSDPAKRARMRTAAKKMWEDPDYSAKISAAIRKKIVVTSILTNKSITYASRQEAIKETGFSKDTIKRCCTAHQVGTGEYSIRYKNESPELKAKHEDMLKILTHTPCVVQTRSGRHLKSFNSSIEAVCWIRDEKRLNPNLLSAYKAISGKSKGGYGPKGHCVRIVRKGPGLTNL